MSKQETTLPDASYVAIPLWRIQQALRDYADAMEQGVVPERSGPDAIRHAALIMEHVI